MRKDAPENSEMEEVYSRVPKGCRMSFFHDVYGVYEDPSAKGHIFRLGLGNALAFHAWNKWTVYVFGWRLFNSR